MESAAHRLGIYSALVMCNPNLKYQEEEAVNAYLVILTSVVLYPLNKVRTSNVFEELWNGVMLRERMKICKKRYPQLAIETGRQ